MNILQGLRAVALATGFKRGEFIGDTKLSPTIIHCHHHHRIAHEKIGPPHITVLQYQISQARALAETCRAALATIHQVMFPLNDQPSGLRDLLRRFENGEAIYRFVCQHLRCGALVALSFMGVHYPEVDMKLVKRLPPTPSGRTDMTAHYTACGRVADCIVAQIINESDKERAAQDPLAA
jgi:hypothetical protein